MFKKLITVIMAGLITAGSLSACSNTDLQTANTHAATIYSSTFPIWDWTNNIIGERSEYVSNMLLLDDGMDLHNYQPTAQDIIKLGTSDLFIYVGGESDGWVDETLDSAAKATNKTFIPTLNLMEELGDRALVEETVEGMQEEEEEEEMFDEHIWLSLVNAKILIPKICDQIKALDPEYADVYQKNCDAYLEKIDALNTKYEEIFKNIPDKTLVFGDRFPYRYMMEDYSIDYYAAFSGCSAETEASFETVSFLSKKIDELGLNYIMILDDPGRAKISDTIKENTSSKNQTILNTYPMQSVTSDKVASTTYLGSMEQTLENMRKALEG